MPLLIHHVIDSSKTDPGSVAPLVRGLTDELATRGLACSVQHAVEDPRSDAIEAMRRANVVHIHACVYEAQIITAALARSLKKPYLLSPAGELAPAAIRRRPRRARWRGKLYERQTVKRAAALLGQNEFEARALRQRYHREVEILPFGVCRTQSPASPPPKTDLPPKRDGRCILMLAPIDPKTGCAAMLKAFAEIGPDANGWHLVIAGDERGDYRKMLEAAIRRKGGGDRVALLPLSDEDTERELLARADVLVSPSLEPGPASSILNAAAYGIPILATQPVLPDPLANAVVACEATRAGIREGLRRILGLTTKSRADLTRNAKRVVRDELEWRVLADRYISLYNSLA